jgi:DNA polymerase-3 subunit epsilon
MLPCYVVLDLETTGGSPQRDRVTEIAAVRMEGSQEVARWSTLVNPGTPIPFFIQNLTGISNQLVHDAPTFANVAPRLLELLDDAVLVAHNARFDHGFLLGELARLQTDLRVRTLCTVRLSRALYPQHRRHSLDAVMQRHGLSSTARHRAMGDVDVMLAWLNVATLEHGMEQVRRHASALLKGVAVPLDC